MLSLSQVAFDIDGVRLIEGFNLSVTPREIVVLIGPSGIGKTTVLRLAAGLQRQTVGTIENRFARTAIVFQEPRLLPWASAVENVGLALDGDGLSSAHRREKAADWLRRLGFDAADLAKHPLQLSGGMQARVAIARAFVTKPDLILMDEPFAPLDLALRRDLQAITRSLCNQSGTAVLFVTHDLAEAVSLADRIVMMSGSPAKLHAVVSHVPTTTDTEMWSAAAELSKQFEITAVSEPASSRC
jgi:NitT/TauT family transport system ATP-binding protein